MPSAADEDSAPLSRLAELPQHAIEWRPAFRLVASRFPPINLFERVADPADWDALYALESLTNPRLRDQTGEISIVPVEDRVAGPGASVIMAPFTHLHPDGSRFADAAHGAFYAAESLETAIAETRHHRQRFLSATHEPPTEIDLRAYLIDVTARLHDLRGPALRSRFAAVYDPDDYSASQSLARALRGRGADGVCYESVRRGGGECVAVFKPRLLGNVRQGAHLRYRWNGARIDSVYELRQIEV